MCSGLGIPLNHRLAVVQEKNVILKVAPNSCNYISFIHRLKVFFFPQHFCVWRPDVNRPHIFFQDICSPTEFNGLPQYTLTLTCIWPKPGVQIPFLGGLTANSTVCFNWNPLKDLWVVPGPGFGDTPAADSNSCSSKTWGEKLSFVWVLQEVSSARLQTLNRCVKKVECVNPLPKGHKAQVCRMKEKVSSRKMMHTVTPCIHLRMSRWERTIGGIFDEWLRVHLCALLCRLIEFACFSWLTFMWTFYMRAARTLPAGEARIISSYDGVAWAVFSQLRGSLLGGAEMDWGE